MGSVGAVVAGVAGGGAELLKIWPYIFGPCHTARPRNGIRRMMSSFFCLASLAFAIACAFFAAEAMATG